jgi:hypothetical protein
MLLCLELRLLLVAFGRAASARAVGILQSKRPRCAVEDGSGGGV